MSKFVGGLITGSILTLAGIGIAAAICDGTLSNPFDDFDLPCRDDEKDKKDGEDEDMSEDETEKNDEKDDDTPSGEHLVEGAGILGGMLGKGLGAIIEAVEAGTESFEEALSEELSDCEKKDDVSSKTEDLHTASMKRSELPLEIIMEEDGSLWIDPNLLKVNPNQPSVKFDQEQLEELCESIKENGILEPILIEVAEDSSFYIIAGERRVRASKMAGLTKVPIRLRRCEK